MNKKTKIVLDSDVLIHFSKANCLSVLPKIFPEFEYIILDIVYNEIKTLQDEIDKHIHHFNSFTFIEFNPQGDMFKEYAQLIKSFGRGESACMSYCKYNNDIIGSSNIKDIKDYCKKEKIVYLTTLDFLYYAYAKKLLTKEECDTFIKTVQSKGSKLPDADITKYTCTKL